MNKELAPVKAMNTKLSVAIAILLLFSTLATKLLAYPPRYGPFTAGQKTPRTGRYVGMASADARAVVTLDAGCDAHILRIHVWWGMC